MYLTAIGTDTLQMIDVHLPAMDSLPDEIAYACTLQAQAKDGSSARAASEALAATSGVGDYALKEMLRCYLTALL